METPCKAWGIGLGRTGTTTLCAAFELLGYERVEHNPTFEQLADLEAAADNECGIYYRYLDYKFPGSKFVLTTRELEPWLESMQFIMERHPVIRSGPRPRGAVPPEKLDISIKRRMLIYESVSFDREKFVAAYHRHHASVRAYFEDRPGDLLEMDITQNDGWDALCGFLGLPVPDAAFPHKNSLNELTRNPRPKTRGSWKRLKGKIRKP